MFEKTITKNEAYKLYLDKGYDELVPFRAKGETDFLHWLQSVGLTVVDDSGKPMLPEVSKNA